MSGLNPEVDPDGLLEYSVVFTDRSLNHMSKAFQEVMLDISSSLKQVYNASSVALVPGGGTYAMEAVARQFAADASVLIVRNGLFSFRWTAILDASGVAGDQTILQARPTKDQTDSPWKPAPLKEIVDSIYKNHPAVVFAPHVETSSGIILPDEYIKAIGRASREVDALFVLDCVASGAAWVDMQASDVDVVITAPQKGWSSTPSAGMVMLNQRARARADAARSSSFACDLGAWLCIMDAYENGGHAYHATLPTDSLRSLRDAIREIEAFGLEKARRKQWELGTRVRALLTERGLPGIAAEGFEAPGVVVCYTDDEGIRTGRKFEQAGLQVAAGVPLKCDEPEGFSTFRVGLFGLDKLQNVDRTVDCLKKALDLIA